jgi:hypothetical protein
VFQISRGMGGAITVVSRADLDLANHRQYFDAAISVISFLPRSGNAPRSNLLSTPGVRRIEPFLAVGVPSPRDRFETLELRRRVSRDRLVYPAAMWVAATAQGSMPCARTSFVTRRFSRAAAKPTPGYLPKLSSFSLPSKRHLRYHNFRFTGLDETVQATVVRQLERPRPALDIFDLEFLQSHLGVSPACRTSGKYPNSNRRGEIGRDSADR